MGRDLGVTSKPNKNTGCTFISVCMTVISNCHCWDRIDQAFNLMMEDDDWHLQYIRLLGRFEHLLCDNEHALDFSGVFIEELTPQDYDDILASLGRLHETDFRIRAQFTRAVIKCDAKDNHIVYHTLAQSF
jgi:hypothetical protein